MCNHYRTEPGKIPDWRHYAGYDMEPAAYASDVWPRRAGLIIRTEGADRIADTMLWGIPRKMRGASGKMLDKRITNVRNLESPFWRSTIAAPAQRCLVPFTSFAEPAPGRDPETGRPAEHWFTLPASPVAAFAGVWRDSEFGPCYGFLTCEPNPLVKPPHPKAMPVILHVEDYDRWLTGTYDDACALAQPYPSQLMAVA